eukprot:TRINITY_DN14463_c0_g1_i1.p1 TRINITY_DN14463_c0_g1~~TRINITY_DN14463_c0_g1_i1.p1  ORF type:complete len:223 (+),score=40.33 TRINITY_DN14463_c0_g1_i1:33-701(+)
MESSMVNITNVEVRCNPASFLSPINFQITFNCSKELKDDLEWKVVYFGDPRNESYDQTLDVITLGPLQSGEMQFEWEVNPPDPKKINGIDNLLGVTALVITASYLQREFFRVGYYVYNNYLVEEEAIENLTMQSIDLQKVQRNILSDKPRITTTNIEWEVVPQSTESKYEETPFYISGQNYEYQTPTNIPSIHHGIDVNPFTTQDYLNWGGQGHHHHLEKLY